MIAPILPFLTPGRPIVLVPDGALHTLNFETLPVPGARRHYWLEDVTLAVAPSLAMLRVPARPSARHRPLRPRSCSSATPSPPTRASLRFISRARSSRASRRTSRRARDRAAGRRRYATGLLRGGARAVLDHPLRRPRVHEPRQPARLDGHPVGRRRGYKLYAREVADARCTPTSSPSRRAAARASVSTRARASSASRGRSSARAPGASSRGCGTWTTGPPST